MRGYNDRLADLKGMEEDMEIEKLQGIIEAILFTMVESVELSKIAAVIEHDESTTRKMIHNMMDRYEEDSRGIRIIELEDSFQMCTKKETYEYLIRIAKQPKRYVLTEVLLETLSIIAYKQPVTKLEIEKIRGVKSDHAVNKLVEYGPVSYTHLGNFFKGCLSGYAENVIICTGFHRFLLIPVSLFILPTFNITIG